MKVLVQKLRDGKPELLETAPPQVQSGQVLIETRATAVSRGTENMLLQFGRGNWLQKAKQQPEQVKQVLQKIRKDGFSPTWNAVQTKLGNPVPMGYCHAGVVVAVGTGVRRFKAGDRVASNGPHATLVSIPDNLVAAIPDEVSFEEAAFTPLAAIALHGLRLAQVTLGETVVVLGLGIVGTMAAQLLKANGCRVFALDPNPEACKRARDLGTEVIEQTVDAEAFIRQQTKGMGADAVLIATAAEDANPVRLAAQLVRPKGRLVLIGTADIHFDRSVLFKKELSFVVSSSYGPGRYDAQYEQQGHDYPLPYVRWTAGRNFEAVLQAMAQGTLQVKPLIGLRVAIEDFDQVYAPQKAFSGTAVFEYPQRETLLPKSSFLHQKTTRDNKSATGVGFIGAGQFAQQILLPTVKMQGGHLHRICSAHGISAGMAARKFGIPHLAGHYMEILQDEAIEQVFIVTRHNLHASITAEALRAGKHVFVEKPLALDSDDLETAIEAWQQRGKVLTVGFNRRFAPLTQTLQQAFSPSTDWHLTYTINAGILPANHWTVDAETGGGRLAGEVCHFIDLTLFLAGAEPESVYCTGSQTIAGNENYVLVLRFQNGSTATIQYLSGGNNRSPKERIEVHGMGKTAVLNNWRTLEIFSLKGRQQYRSRQDKGHTALVKKHLEAVAGKTTAPIPMHHLVQTTKATIAAKESLQSGIAVSLRNS